MALEDAAWLAVDEELGLAAWLPVRDALAEPVWLVDSVTLGVSEPDGDTDCVTVCDCVTAPEAEVV